MANQTVAGLLVSIDGNTVRLRNEIDKAQSKVKEFSRETKASMVDAKGSIMLMGEEIGVHLPRQLQRFLTQLPGVAPVMATAFSAFAVIGIGKALIETGDKLADFVQKANKAGEMIAAAMEKAQESTRVSAHEIELANARMEETLAKLQHKPENGLAVALAEARVEADKLTKSLDAVFDAEIKALKEHKLGIWAAIATSQKQTGPAAEMAERFKKAVADINKDFNDQLDSAVDDKQRKTINDNRYAALTAELTRERNEAAEAWNQLNQEKERAARTPVPSMGGGSVMPAADTSAIMGAFGTMGHDAEEQLRLLKDTQQQGSLTEKTRVAQAKQEEIAQAHADAAKRMEAYRNELERISDGILDDDSRFWEKKLALEKKGSDNYLAIEAAIAKIARRAYVEGDKRDEEYDKLQRGIFSDADKSPDQDEGFRAANKEQNDLLVARIKAMGELIGIQRELAEQQQELSIKMAVSNGTMTKQTADIQLAAIGVEALNRELEQLQAKRADLQLHPERQTASDNVPQLDNDIALKAGQISFANQQLRQMQQLDTLNGAMGEMFNEWIIKAEDLRDQVKNVLDSSLNSVNDTLGKMLSGQYKRGDWTRTGQTIFSGISKTALQDGEGFLMKGLKLGGMGKLGTMSNPMYVKSVDPLPGVTGADTSSLLTGLGGAGTQGGGLGGFGSVLGAALSFLPMADGGPMSPGNYLVGERGPELMQIGSAGYIHNAERTKSMMGSTHHHTHNYHIDARGAHDPAAVNAAVRRGIAEAAPHIAASAIAAQKDMQRRRPSQAGM